MTIAAVANEIAYTGDGVSTSFSVPFNFDTGADLKVFLTDLTTGAVVQLSSGYSVVGSSVVFVTPPTATTRITILDDPELTQPTDYSNLDAFPAESHERALDRVTRLVKRLHQQWSRTLRFPDGDVITDGTVSSTTNRRGRYLFFNATTGAVEYATAVGVTTLSKSLIAGLLKDQTAEEILSGAVIVDFSREPMQPERYALNATPGTTDMTAAVQMAIDVAMISGGTVDLSRSTQYKVTAPLDATWAGSGGAPPITIRGASGGHNLNTGLMAVHTGVAIIDCTGNDTIRLVDLGIHTPVPAASIPKTGVLWARNNHGSSLINRMERCAIVGSFSVACLYNYGSENSYVAGCYFANYNTAANTATRIYTANNISALTSIVGGLIATGAQSCIVHDSIGNADLNRAGTSTSDCVRLEQADSFHSFGGWMSSASGSTKGRSLIWIDQTFGVSPTPSSNGVIQALTAENNANPPDYCIGFSTATATTTPTGWTVENCRFISATRAIAAVDNKTTFDGLRISHISELTSKGISIPGTLQGSSDLSTGPMLLNIGTVSATCFLRGTKSNWTIGTLNGVGMDTGSAVPSGFGSPTGNSVIANFPGGSATLLQTSQTVAEIVVLLKQYGFIVA